MPSNIVLLSPRDEINKIKRTEIRVKPHDMLLLLMKWQKLEFSSLKYMMDHLVKRLKTFFFNKYRQLNIFGGTFSSEVA